MTVFTSSKLISAPHGQHRHRGKEHRQNKPYTCLADAENKLIAAFRLRVIYLP
ncbi:hypothetical protein [Mucilaginibacter sp.]